MLKYLILSCAIICSCHCDWCGESGIPYASKLRCEEYYWYCNDTLFVNADSCQVIGFLSSKHDNEVYSVNRRCCIYHDSIYIEKRIIAGHHNFFDGVLYIKGDEYYISVELR